MASGSRRPHDPTAIVRATWHSFAGSEHDSLLEVLLAQHGAAGRHYHSLAHVAWVVHHLEHIIEHLEPAEVAQLDVDALRLAALSHDVVYDPRSSRNEAESAAFAAQCADDLGWSAERRSRVERAVLATASHRPSDLFEAVLVDADLAILGASPIDYAGYVDAVRREYAHVDDEVWRVGRAGVLRHLLDSPTVFTTPVMRASREATARANLQHELDALGVGADVATETTLLRTNDTTSR